MICEKEILGIFIQPSDEVFPGKAQYYRVSGLASPSELVRTCIS